MQIIYYLIPFVIIFFSLLLKLLKKLNTNTTFFKILSLALAGVFCVRYFGEKEALYNTIGLNINSPINNMFLTAVSLILIWFTFASVLLLILYPFYEQKISRNIIKFFSLPVFILNYIFLFCILVGLSGREAFTTFNYRSLFFSIETGLSISYALFIMIDYKKEHSTKKEGLYSFVVCLLMIACSIPGYVPQGLFGYVNRTLRLRDFTFEHRLALYLSILIPTLIYFGFRNKDFKTRKFTLLYLSLALLISFCINYKADTLIYITNWPIHLCHTAMFIVPLCLIFKWQKVFYFALFINVLGAFFAMFIPNTNSETIICTSSVLFWLNHFSAFFMPVLLVVLDIFERPKLKQYFYSITAFTVYFVLILIINAWFSNYASVDYFFVNSGFIAEKLGVWAERLRDIVLTINIGSLKFIFYPLYQFIFYLVYVLLALGMWFIYEQLFSIIDLNIDMKNRRQKINIEKLAFMSQLNGRSVEEPVNQNGINKLILKDFSKKYASSNVFAVDKANLVVECGEIYGFLGPNGAGKSSIIKTIVGIQPITSGEIQVCGYDVEKQPVEAKRLIGFVPDHYVLYENLTGREYINYIADLYNVSQEDRTKRINDFLDRFELHNTFDNQIKTYSHGMKQKIAIIAALIHNPKVWILDEPLTGLDPNSIYQVKECMKKHASEGNIVFFSSHIIDVVERICTKIAIIKKGHILLTRDVKELEDSGENLEEFYLKTINGENKIIKD